MEKRLFVLGLISVLAVLWSCSKKHVTSYGGGGGGGGGGGAAAITVVSPNGGESWVVGTKHVITWNASGLTSGSVLRVSFSTDGGATWDTVPKAGNLAYTARSFNWDISGPATTRGRILVANISGSQTLASDKSDTTFTTVLTSNQPYVVDSMRVGSGPYGVAITPDGAYAYVTCSSFSGVDSVYIISTANDSVVARIGGMSQPRGIAILPSGTFAYVANNLGGTVSAIATATRSVVSIPTAASPSGVAASPDSRLVYIVHSGSSNYITVIDAKTNSVYQQIPGAGQGGGIAVRPDNARYVYSTRGSGSFVVLDTLGFIFQSYSLSGTGSSGIAFRPSGAEAYIANATSNNVSVVTTSPPGEVAVITVSGAPTGVAMVPSGNYAYVSQSTGNNLAVINTGSRAIVATVSSVGISPLGLAATPSGRYVYVAANGSNKIYVVYTNGF